MVMPKKGFSLIELMIVLLIVGILSVIAYPMYTSHVERTRRSEGMSALRIVANDLESFYSASLSKIVNGVVTNVLNGHYTDSITANYPNEGLGYDNTFSRTRLYDLSIRFNNDDKNTYIITATPTWADPDCGDFLLTNSGLEWVSADYDGDGNDGDGNEGVGDVADIDDIRACWR